MSSHRSYLLCGILIHIKLDHYLLVGFILEHAKWLLLLDGLVWADSLMWALKCMGDDQVTLNIQILGFANFECVIIII